MRSDAMYMYDDPTEEASHRQSAEIIEHCVSASQKPPHLCAVRAESLETNHHCMIASSKASAPDACEIRTHHGLDKKPWEWLYPGKSEGDGEVIIPRTLRQRAMLGPWSINSPTLRLIATI